jgi:LysM repeat protein
MMPALFACKTRRLFACVGLSIALAASLLGCTSSTGGNEAVRLVITPVATPTQTQPVPPTAAPVTYTVKAGDTLSGIADLFGVTLDDIVRVNNIADPNSLAEGQVLTIPGRSPASTPTGIAQGTASPAGSQTPGATGSPVLPPPGVTPPLGPTTGEPTAGALSTPGPNVSPTAAP